MQPLTLRKVIEFYPGEWLVYQTFDKFGKPVTVRAFGKDRQEALINFAEEVKYTWTHSEYSMIDDLACWMFDVAGRIDHIKDLIKALIDNFHAVLMLRA